MTPGGRLAKAKARCWEVHARYYPEPPYKHHDDRYREKMAALLRPDARVLDAGCGSDMPFTREISPKVATAAGIDYGVLQRVGAGTVGVQGDLGRLPFRDAAFHAVVSRSVLEHLKDPARVFAELFRVLKPGGTVVLLTPNKYDYVSLVSMATPFRFHQWLVSRTQDRREEDAFPTYYRANSKGRIRSLLEGSGFRSVKVELFNQYPAYLMFSPTLFRLGVLYERVTSRYRSLEQLRGWILAVGRKA